MSGSATAAQVLIEVVAVREDLARPLPLLVPGSATTAQAIAIEVVRQDRGQDLPVCLPLTMHLCRPGSSVPSWAFACATKICFRHQVLYDGLSKTGPY